MSTMIGEDGYEQLLDSEDGLSTTGRWTQEEHELFLRGLKLYNRQWKQIADIIKTRTVVQIRTHAQKYFQKLNKCNKVTCLNPDSQPDLNQVVKMKTIPSIKSVKDKDIPSIERNSTLCLLPVKAETILDTPDYFGVSNTRSIDELTDPEFLSLKPVCDVSDFEWLASCLSTVADPLYDNIDVSNTKYESANCRCSNNTADQQITRVHEDFVAASVNDNVYIDFTWLEDKELVSKSNNLGSVGNMFESGSHTSSSCETSEESSSNSSEEDSSPFDNEMLLFDNSLCIGRFSDDIFDKFNENRKKSISCLVFEESLPKKRGRPNKSINSSSMREHSIDEINYIKTNNNHSAHLGQMEMSKNSYSIGDMTNPGFGNSEDEFSTFFGLDL